MQNIQPLKICVRLPNWLGDTVMSVGFLHLLRLAYPNAFISVVTKKGLEQLVNDFPQINEVFVFTKKKYKGIRGVWKYGKRLAERHRYDLFFVLPDSFSSAMMAYASGAKQRIGFKEEARSFLLTHSYTKPAGKHRVEEYASLIQQFNPAVQDVKPVIKLPFIKEETTKPYIVININSESLTSRLPPEKAIELITLVQQQFTIPIKLIGSPKEESFVQEVFNRLLKTNNVENIAGTTTLHQLQILIQNAALMITSDSGPAHIASASGVPLVVITGAGDENNTGPYDNPKAIAVRNGTLPCEPCVKNYCKLAPLPQCLVQMQMQKAIDAVSLVMNKNNDN